MLRAFSRRLRPLGLAAVLTLNLGATLRAAVPAAELRTITERYAAAIDFSGAVLVAKNGRVLYSAGFGSANREWAVPNTADTRFRICSITKSFTAVLVLQLVQSGKLALDRTVASLLPDYPAAVGEKITVHDLLVHRSGLPVPPDAAYALPLSSAEFIRRYASGPLAAAPGTAFAYNNADYILLGAIIEKITGRTYAEVLREKILLPAGLTETALLTEEAIVPHLAAGYPLDDTRPGQLQRDPPYAITNFGPAGALTSTVNDLLRYDDALYTDKLLDARHREILFTADGRAENYVAYGHWVFDRPVGALKSVRMIERRGNIYGFAGVFLRCPNEHRTIIILANTGRFNPDTFMDPSSLKEQLILALYGQPQPAPPR